MSRPAVDRSDFAELVATRRDLHAHPELGFAERRTSALVADRLRALGYTVKTGLGRTGVVGTMRGGATVSRAERKVLLRADMDALPVQEAGDAPYRSTVPGVMHACGHDAHVAIALAVARRLADARAEWRGMVKLVFQPAEESGAGAQAMIDDGVLDAPAVDAAFGLHVISHLPTGTIAATAGAVMGSVDNFTVRIAGKGGHAAMPQDAVDPVLAAAHVVTALQSLVSRGADPFDQLVVSVTRIAAGTTSNVIPEHAELEGTVRTLGGTLHAEVPDRFTALVRSVAGALGCTATVAYARQTPPVVNDEAMTALVAGAAAGIVGEPNVLRNARMLGGEDFACFLQRVPGCFAWVGCGNAEKGVGAPHHSPRFDIDEEAMLIGAELLERVTREYLR
ncbi:MAG TPA: amidohydrolase [Gemmatimonadales bacterium]|nr:amidohydrolase [Gemmatimonadales bacterium]